MAFTVAGRPIGEGAPCWVVAEAGVNHNGRAELAHRLVDAAADAGADVIKFQTFDPVLLASPAAVTAEYQQRTQHHSQLDMLRGLTLPEHVFADLQDHAQQRGLVFLSTPFDRPSVDLLTRLDVPAFKISSGDLTDHLLLRQVARAGRPVLLSTGMSTLEQVERAMAAIREIADVPIALLHCVSSYPAPAAACNLRAMAALRQHFSVPVGFSDHTLGTSVALAAVALGATIVEKHLTLDARMPGPDHQASLEPDDFADLVSGVRDVEAALGSGAKVVVPIEREASLLGRRSLHWHASLAEGVLVEEEHLLTLRPADGLTPEAWRDVVGRRTTRAVAAGDLVRAGDVT
jgi:N-acetylneuraminate synthase/N,N'-diacetyllegionaminate synthase